MQHSVGLVSQSRNDLCWADYSDLDVANSYPHNGTGAGPDDWNNLAHHHRLDYRASQCLGPDDWEKTIANGPAIVVIPGKPWHAVVVSGAESDGTIDGSRIYVEDPGGGERWWDFSTFTLNFEAGAENPVDLVTL
jgi:hypothetical protein